MHHLYSHFDKHGLSHSFTFTAIGGVFLVFSGIFVDPNTGRAITGLIIACRGGISEIFRLFLKRRGYAEEVTCLPGMLISTLMNWPVLIAAASFLEAISFGLAVIVVSLKFLQYLPRGLEALSPSSFMGFLFSGLANKIRVLNYKFLNSINRQSVYMAFFAVIIYAFDVYARKDVAGALAILFLIYGAVALGIKTRIELKPKT